MTLGSRMGGGPLRVEPPRRAIDGPLVAYGLVTGILAVSAGIVAASLLDRLGVTRQLISVAITLLIALVAIVFASRILRWILSTTGSAEAHNTDDGRGDRKH